MAKDYVRRPTKRKSSVPKQLFWMFASFLAGYLTATVFDFTSLTSWVNGHLLTKHQNSKPKVRVAAKEPELPKPKFEFYTLLAKGGHTPSAVPLAKPTAPNQTRLPAQSVATGAAPLAPTNPSSGQISAKQPGTVAVVEGKPVTPSSVSKESYQIQIAAFKNRQDAEQMKAALTLKGFDVNIVTTSQHNVNWYRVIVGPFNSRIAAEKIQLLLAKSEHAKGMIRKYS